jgi:glycosyltransferase involved in cell wall biosynthesis
MSKPRIAIDFTHLDSVSPASGQYRYVIELVRGLERLRPGMDFLLLGSRTEPVPELSAVFQKHGDRWKYRQLPRNQFRGSDHVDHARYGWVLLRERINVLHALHTFVPLLAPCPVVITMYDLMYELFDDYAEARRSRPYRRYKWAVQHLARRIVCISETTAADLHRLWGIEGNRTDTVPLGTTSFAVKEISQDVQTKIQKWITTPFVLLSPFNLEPRKNLNALIEAVALLRPRYEGLRLILFGRAGITPEREKQFERRIRELDLGKNLIQTGLVTDDELAALYRRASLFVFPSLYEGFGLPVLEAMSAGACVIARNASAMAEVLGETGALVETQEPQELASAITTLLDNAVLRRELGRLGQQRATLFSVERMAQLTCQSYLTALDQKAHGSPVYHCASS